MNSIVNEGWLLTAATLTAAASLGVVVIALLRPLLMRSCGAVATLRLWWILPLALAATALPKVTVITIEAPAAAPMVMEEFAAAAPAPAPPAARAAGVSWQHLLLAIWLSGAALTAARMILAQRRFLAGIRWRPDGRGTLPSRTGPALIGALAPRLALPADFHLRYSPAERRLMLLHEAVHRRRRDGLAGLGMSLLLMMQWFNPLVHWAARTLSRDQESACDATVIARHPSLLRVYADALLKSHPEMTHLPLVCRWQAYHPTVERIAMLKLHRDAHTRSGLAVVLLTAGAALASALVYAVEPATEVIVVAEASAVPPATPAIPVVPPAPASTLSRVSAAAPAAPALPRLAANAARPALSASPAPPVAAGTQWASSVPATAATPPTPPAPPAPASAPTARWDRPEKFSFNFTEIGLDAFVGVSSSMARTKITGTDQLKGTKVSLRKRDVPVGQTLRVVLGCAGYAIAEADDGYAIVRQSDPVARETVDACIEAGLPSGPEHVLNDSEAVTKLRQCAATTRDLRGEEQREALRLCAGMAKPDPAIQRCIDDARAMPEESQERKAATRRCAEMILQVSRSARAKAQTQSLPSADSGQSPQQALVMEGLNEISRYRLATVEFFARQGRFPRSTAELGLPERIADSKSASRIDIASSSPDLVSLRISYADWALPNNVLVMTGKGNSGGVNFSLCDEGTTLPAAWLPVPCTSDSAQRRGG